MQKKIIGILLAAGRGSRFGGGKLLHRLPDGASIGVAAANNLKSACERIHAVLRPEDEELAAKLKQAGCDIVFCPEAAGGMGHSLAAGVQAANDADAWIVALGDMPFIKSATHSAVAACLMKGSSLVATQYHGKRGHPVGFSREWFSQLSAMTGDQGGKPILESHPERLVLCPVDDPGVLQDIDHRADLAAIWASQGTGDA